MKLFRKTTMLLLALAIVAAVVHFWLGSDAERQNVEETRRGLRDQGFKTDLSEFNFYTTLELRAREGALTNAGSQRLPNAPAQAGVRSLRQQLLPALMQPVGADAAILVWRQPRLASDVGAEYRIQAEGLSSEWDWQVMRRLLHADRELLDAACLASLSGPIRFNLDASQGGGLLLPHLSAMKDLARTLGCRAILALYEGNKDAAWTNTLATTRLVTAWIPEPIEASGLVRIACASIAFDTIWQVLPAGRWGEERLSALQHEWETVDFFSGLPETVAYARASAVAACQQARQKPPPGFAMTFRQVLRSPSKAWAALVEYRRQVRYRLHGSYEDEKDLLLHYRDREVELKRALEAQTWAEMQRHPGVTNMVPFLSGHRSTAQTRFNLRQMALGIQMYKSPGRVQSLPGRAAYAEARRRLIVTAIALERYHDRHGAHPNTLDDLVPEFLENSPVDFMDGQSLRYRLTGDGHFVLYSVGFDGVDHGGRSPAPLGRGRPVELMRAFGDEQGADLIWPRPASMIDAPAQAE